MPPKPRPPGDLREACLQAAQSAIAEHGVEALSLRDVARRLNVSHQAPYKHFANRDQLLAEIIRRCFERFANRLREALVSDEPRGILKSMGERYLAFALEHPLEYRLMFGTPWPSVADHPDLLRDARAAFDVLRQGLRPLYAGHSDAPVRVDRDAMFVWSTMHGLASILQSNAVAHLGMDDAALDEAARHVMKTIDDLLQTRSPADGPPRVQPGRSRSLRAPTARP